MDTNAAVKYFKLFRDEHPELDDDYVTNGEVLLWLTNKLEAEVAKQEKEENKIGYAADVDQSINFNQVKIGVHQTHCCLRHGCKYGDNNCPVVLGEIKQRHMCEFCEDEGPIKSWNDIFAEVGQYDSLANHLIKNYNSPTSLI